MGMQKQTAVALGLFDGVHEGHRAVLQAACRQKKNGMVPSAFSFQSEMAESKQAAGYIYPTDLKIWMLENQCGIERVLAPPFEIVCEMTGEDFVRNILCERMNAGYVCCGSDFRFGRGARWDVQDLQRLGEQCGFTVEVINDVRVGGVTVSSTEIRELLAAGDLNKANLLLGSPYLLRQKVVHGAHLGTSMSFPTINQPYQSGQLVPKYGVYASETKTPEGWFMSVTNIGVKPTVDYDGMPVAETHIIDYAGDLYGQTIEVVLTKMLREEQKFDDLDALIDQMNRDLIVRRQLSKSYHEFNT